MSQTITETTFDTIKTNVNMSKPKTETANSFLIVDT
jgi:hypothetical protein